MPTTIIWTAFLFSLFSPAFCVDTKSLENHVAFYKKRMESTTHKKCKISSTESCHLNAMARDESTLIQPGGNTRCIFSTSTPYAFQVIPGDSDKLLFYFQGGGACWDQLSTSAGTFCTTDANPQSLVGIFDRSNPNNAFRSYTIVHALYCSGDVFGGNVVRPYNDSKNQPVVQVGLKNAQSAVDWIKAQIKAGSLAKTFSSFVVMGCSAGSLGAQIWSKTLLDTFSYKTAAVVPDSYAGYFPEGTEGPLMYDYGFCTSGFLSTALQAKCNAKTLLLRDLNLEFITAHPKVPYSFIQAKVDEVQISFYVALGTLSVKSSMNSTITPASFYNGVNEIFSLYNNQEKNFVVYLINGDHHCYTDQALYYTADTVGATDSGKGSNALLLHEWLNQLPLQSGKSIETLCDGKVQTPENHEESQRALVDNTYCSKGVVPKTYTQV